MFDEEIDALTPTPVEARVGQLEEALRAEQDTNLLLQESIADLALAADDRGWDLLGAGGQTEFTRDALRRICQNARLMVVANPLCRRGAQLDIAYVWGQGLSVSAREASDDTGGQDVNAVVQGFLDHKLNRASFTSGQAREELERALVTDGNVFLANVTKPVTGRVRVRSIAFDEIVDIVYNPDDGDEPWYYLRQWTVRAQFPGAGKLVKQTRRLYYPALDYRPTQKPASFPSVYGQVPVQWDSPVLHVSVNRLSGWMYGIGDAYAALPWARSYKDFLTDWARLVKALSRYAWKLTGDKSLKIRAAVDKIRSAATTAQQASLDGSIAGATFAEGPGGNLEAIPKTGATIDSDSGRPLAAMAAAAFGVPVTMLTANPGPEGARAVAETLDRPTELEKGLRRELWIDVHRRILDYVIARAVAAPAGALKGTVALDEDGLEVVTLAGDIQPTVDITFPEMSEISVDLLMKAISLADRLPPLVRLRLELEALGVDDIDEILDSVTDDAGNYVDPDLTAGQAIIDRFRQGADPANALT